jgi:antitoxin VapB
MAYVMGMERDVRLFRNGRNQAVRIPRDFELPGKIAVMRKEGDRLVLEPKRKRQSFARFLATLAPVEEAFPEIPELPHDPPPNLG